MNILLVDDHPETCETLARFLTRLGYSVQVNSSGEEALQEYCKGDFPLVLSDIRMPGLSGIELLQAIKRHSYAWPFKEAVDRQVFHKNRSTKKNFEWFVVFFSFVRRFQTTTK